MEWKRQKQEQFILKALLQQKTGRALQFGTFKIKIYISIKSSPKLPMVQNSQMKKKIMKKLTKEKIQAKLQRQKIRYERQLKL